MSQAKVDKYKVEKANRKEIIAKEKRQKMIMKIVGSSSELPAATEQLPCLHLV